MDRTLAEHKQDELVWGGFAKDDFSRMTWPRWLFQDDFPGVAFPPRLCRNGHRSARSQSPVPPGFVPWSRRWFLHPGTSRLPGAGGPGLALVAPVWRGALRVGAAAPWQLQLRQQRRVIRIHPHSHHICCRRSARIRGKGGGGRRVLVASPSPLRVPQPAASPSTTAARTRCPTAPR